MSAVVHTFYKFVDLPDYVELREPLLACCREADLTGTILLAEEGVNGTVAGTEEGLNRLWAFFRADPRLADMPFKQSVSASNTFYRIKVRLKKEIVTLGVDGIHPAEETGTYVEARDWNALISDPEVCLVDTRNQYEIGVGRFPGATDPETTSFREFPAFVDQKMNPEEQPKVAMYCTGGIRCEKATAYLLSKGFKEVYHLKGGILKYLEDVPCEESLWEGECFVFDNRVTVNSELADGSYAMCHACRQPLSEEDLSSPHYEPGVSCAACYKDPEEKKKRARDRAQQMALAKQRGEKHLGAVMPKTGNG